MASGASGSAVLGLGTIGAMAGAGLAAAAVGGWAIGSAVYRNYWELFTFE
jgi:hypothetical protein